jgi:hypothetical protein
VIATQCSRSHVEQSIAVQWHLAAGAASCADNAAGMGRVMSLVWEWSVCYAHCCITRPGVYKSSLCARAVSRIRCPFHSMGVEHSEVAGSADGLMLLRGGVMMMG